MVFKKNIYDNDLFIKRWRLLAGFAFFIIAVVIAGLVKIQVIDTAQYKALAKKQHLAERVLEPNRGKIYIHDWRQSADTVFPIAINQKYYMLYAVPSEIKDPADVSDKIISILALDKEKEFEPLVKKLSRSNDIYEPLIHKLDEDKKKSLTEAKITGLYFSEETWRYYPEQNAFSHLTGFVGYSGDELKGRYGLEGYFEKELAGTAGEYVFEKDAFGNLIPIADRSKSDVKDGSDIVLTIDRSIQFTACKSLKNWVQKAAGASGSVIIVDPNSGAILAMCNYPDYNPNEYNKVEDIGIYVNQAISTPYEPGSVFKAITMAIGLDMGKVEPLTTYNDTGVEKIAGFEIKNSDKKAHGIQTMTQVLEASLNTGVIYVSRLLGIDVFRNYVKNFGFGQSTNIPLAQENPADISSIKRDSEIFMATASFGQGITATPLQMVMAFSAIANGGNLLKPFLVEKIVQADGQTNVFKSEVVRNVIKPQTAAELSAMLASVVKYGHAKKAAVDGYFIAGKTGTAQVAGKYGGYEPGKTIHTFIGFAPVDKPKFVMLTKVDFPQNAAWAESSAAPMFGEIAQYLLNYLKVPPSY
jgi:cell division protein FtsI/penicillin-binding protein 2